MTLPPLSVEQVAPQPPGGPGQAGRYTPPAASPGADDVQVNTADTAGDSAILNDALDEIAEELRQPLTGSRVQRNRIGPGLLPGLAVLNGLIETPEVPKNLIRRGERRDGCTSAEVMAGLSQGWSVQIEHAERYSERLARLCGELEDRLSGENVRVNLYYTEASGQPGFPVHHDTLDLAVIHVAGIKRWQVWPRTIEYPIWHMRDHRQPVDQNVPALDVDLAPGDVLSVRQGDPHRAYCVTGPCLHLSLGVLRPNGHDLIRWLVDQAVDQPAVRAPMPAGYGRDHSSPEQLAWIADVFDRVAQLIQARTPEGWLEAFLHDQAGMRPHPGTSNIELGENVSAHSHVRWSHPQLASRLSGGTLTADRRTITVPDDLVAALTLIRARRQRWWTVGDLARGAHVTVDRLLALVRVLAQHGLIVVSDTPTDNADGWSRSDRPDGTSLA